MGVVEVGVVDGAAAHVARVEMGSLSTWLLSMGPRCRRGRCRRGHVVDGALVDVSSLPWSSPSPSPSSPSPSSSSSETPAVVPTSLNEGRGDLVGSTGRASWSSNVA